MECIAFTIDKYDFKIPFLGVDDTKQIAPILSAIYREYSNDTPQQVLIKDYDFIAEDEILKKSPLVQTNMKNGLDRALHFIKSNAKVETEGALLDSVSTQTLLNDKELLNDVYGTSLFFFAIARYLGKKVLESLEPPLVVDYSA